MLVSICANKENIIIIDLYVFYKTNKNIRRNTARLACHDVTVEGTCDSNNIIGNDGFIFLA